MNFLEVPAGILLLAFGTYVFWRIGQKDAIRPQWRGSLGVQCLAVLAVLGGWAGGTSLLVRSAIMMFSN